METASHLMKWAYKLYCDGISQMILKLNIEFALKLSNYSEIQEIYPSGWRTANVLMKSFCALIRTQIYTRIWSSSLQYKYNGPWGRDVASCTTLVFWPLNNEPSPTTHLKTKRHIPKNAIPKHTAVKTSNIASWALVLVECWLTPCRANCVLGLLHQLHRVSRFVHDISGFVSKEGANLVANKEE
jgi:hypothetical protein